MRRLLIVGAGGHGRVVADCAAVCGTWSEIAFTDARHPALDQSGEWPVIGTDAATAELVAGWDDVLVAIGDNRTRQEWLTGLRESGANLPVLVHPSAAVSPRAGLEPGSVVFSLAAVNTGARAGLGCIINTGAIVDHDCTLGDAVHVAPGARLAGGVRVGDRAWIGMGASIGQYRNVGAECIVGAGAVVIRDAAAGETLVGVPARPLETNR